MSFQPQPQQDRQPLPRRREAEGTSGRSMEQSRMDTSSVDRVDTSDSGVGGMSRTLMIGLIVLALVASILMLFLDSDMWLKIAVIAALWAAFLGAVLVSRYSSALSAERDRSRQLQRTHNAELEREKSEHQKREAMLESSYEQRIRDQRDEHLEQLRQELEVMRQQLAAMSGGDFGAEQTSVHAKAERVREIENSVNAAAATPSAAATSAAPSAASSSATTPLASDSQKEEKREERRSSTFSTGTFAAIKWGGQDAAETSELPLIVDTTALDEDEARKADAQKQAAQPEDRTSTASHSAPSAHVEKPAPQPHHHAATGASTIASKGGDSYVGGHRRKDESQEAKAESRRGRRRADESASGLTVAELMARFKKDD